MFCLLRRVGVNVSRRADIRVAQESLGEFEVPVWELTKLPTECLNLWNPDERG
jgi:hypothetical protein